MVGSEEVEAVRDCCGEAMTRQPVLTSVKPKNVYCTFAVDLLKEKWTDGSKGSVKSDWENKRKHIKARLEGKKKAQAIGCKSTTTTQLDRPGQLGLSWH